MDLRTLMFFPTDDDDNDDDFLSGSDCGKGLLWCSCFPSFIFRMLGNLRDLLFSECWVI